MRLRRLLFIVLGALLIVGAVPSFTLAQQQDVQRAAAERFRAGVAAMREGDFGAALERFERAEELHSHGANRFNIAVCLEELGRLREAELAYRLALESGQLPEERVREARLRMDGIGERLATVSLVAAPGGSVSAGAVASVDGQSCSLPCRLRVDPGAHRVSAQGFLRDVQVPEGGEVEVAVVVPPGGVAEEPAPVVSEGAVSEGAVSEAPPEGSSRRGWWITGGALAVLGGAGTLAFGLHTQAIKEEFDAAPSAELQEDGRRYRGLTNGSIAVAGVGVGLMVVALILEVADSDGSEGVAASPGGVTFRF